MPGHRWIKHRVALGETAFPYWYAEDCVDGIASAIAEMDADRLLLITDDTVLDLHGRRLARALERHAPVTILSHPAGEAMKQFEVLSATLEGAVAGGASRRSLVVALGGGVPGNLAGLAASLLFRGVRLVHVPTTTVAAMDSVLSLKQAINSSRGKNHFGAYHRPEAVFTDLEMLKTLPRREVRSGLSEAAKNCLAIDPTGLPDFFDAAADPASTRSLRWLLEHSLATKSSVTLTDARESSSGMVLEYGHTVGHAIELCDQRRRGAQGLSHGQAVALGMLVEATVAHHRGHLDAEDLETHRRALAALDVPEELPPGTDVAEVMSRVAADNKRGLIDAAADEVVMVELESLGRPRITGSLPLTAVPARAISDVLEALPVADASSSRRHLEEIA